MIGIARIVGALLYAGLRPVLDHVAFELHDDPGIVRLDPRWHQAAARFVGAILATPNPARRKGERFMLAEDRIQELESEIDAWVAELDELKTFILPGGGKAASLVHLARAACRRAERAIVGLEADDLPATLVPYVNRLSDWLFTCARALNAGEGIAETPW